MNRAILLTTYRFREDDCIQEAWFILSKYGFKEFEPIKLGMPGLALLLIDFDPIKAVQSIIDYAKLNVWSIKYILRAIPIEILVKNEENEIINAAMKLSEKIKEEDTYRITIKKRGSKIRSEDLIKTIAENLKRKVDLENYVFEILIEMFEEKAGVSVIKKDQKFVLHKARKKAIEELIDHS